MKSSIYKFISLFKLVGQHRLTDQKAVDKDAQLQNQKIHKVKQDAIHDIRKEKGCKVFIETGTYLGDMVEAQRSNFSNIFSIELSDDLYRDAVSRFKEFPNVQILYGDSGKVLFDLMPSITEPAIFWLDGHYSQGVTAKGEKECPIYEELRAILTSKPFSPCVID